MLPRAITQRLEGSRFGAFQTNPRYSFRRLTRPQNIATGGSHELPSVMHLPPAFRFVYPRPIELRPAASFPGAACCHTNRAIRDRTNVARATRYAPKRLPSRRLAMRHGRNDNNDFEDEDDDEYEDESLLWMLQTGPRGWLRLEDPAVRTREQTPNVKCEL